MLKALRLCEWRKICATEISKTQIKKSGIRKFENLTTSQNCSTLFSFSKF